jgi:hypothetical protein
MPPEILSRGIYIQKFATGSSLKPPPYSEKPNKTLIPPVGRTPYWLNMHEVENLHEL